MRFKGDIIITDPCYICKEKEEVGEYPDSKDYFSYSSEKRYPDYRKMDENEIKALEDRSGFTKEFLLDEWVHKSDQREEENKNTMQHFRNIEKIIFLIGNYATMEKTWKC